MSKITLKELSNALGFETLSDLETRYSASSILDIMDNWQIEEYLECDWTKQLSEYSDAEIEDEAEERGMFNRAYVSVSDIVQSHRCGKLKIVGENASALLEHIYSIANKVV